MTSATIVTAGPGARLENPSLGSDASAVSWAAIFAGAATAIAATLVLTTLGSGIGFSSVSPWPNSGASASTFTMAAAIYLIVVQWLSAALGGYMAGRLRTRWTGLHTDEVFFRDTAHGLLSWATATVFVAAMVGFWAMAIAGAGTQAASSAAQGAAQGAAQSSSTLDPTSYMVDTLFRSDRPDPAANQNADPRPEAIRIFAMSAKNGRMAANDRTYLAQMVAARTGISQADAEKRIDDLSNQARATADEARKASAKASFYLFFSMLIGAFIACVGGAMGGRLRDEY